MRSESMLLRETGPEWTGRRVRSGVDVADEDEVRRRD